MTRALESQKRTGDEVPKRVNEVIKHGRALVTESGGTAGDAGASAACRCTDCCAQRYGDRSTAYFVSACSRGISVGGSMHPDYDEVHTQQSGGNHEGRYTRSDGHTDKHQRGIDADRAEKVLTQASSAYRLHRSPVPRHYGRFRVMG